MKYIIGSLVILLSGCVSQVLPPGVAETELNIDRPVYVEPYRFPAYSQSLQSALEGTEIFSEVHTAKPPNSPVYVARVNRRVHGNAVIPFWTFLTLGVFPTITEEEFGESFDLIHDGKTYTIDATWKGNTVLGWAALPLNLLPDRVSENPEKTRRFHAFLKSKIAEAIER